MADSEQKNMTEKNLRRVLTSSICSILVCMMCLAGTTWAWFTVEINAGSIVIETGAPVQLQVEIRNEDELIAPAQGATLLAGGKTYDISLSLAEELSKDDLGYSNDVYAIMTLVAEDSEGNGYSESYYTILGEGNESYVLSDLAVAAGTEATVSFETAWFEPDNSFVMNYEPIQIGQEPQDETEPPEGTEDTEPSTEESTEPETETTEPSTEESTEPDTEAPEPSTEESTEPDTGTTEPPTEESVELSTEATETTTEEPADRETEPVADSDAEISE